MRFVFKKHKIILGIFSVALLLGISVFATTARAQSPDFLECVATLDEDVCPEITLSYSQGTIRGTADGTAFSLIYKGYHTANPDGLMFEVKDVTDAAGNPLYLFLEKNSTPEEIDFVDMGFLIGQSFESFFKSGGKDKAGDKWNIAIDKLREDYPAAQLYLVGLAEAENKKIIEKTISFSAILTVGNQFPNSSPKGCRFYLAEVNEDQTLGIQFGNKSNYEIYSSQTDKKMGFNASYADTTSGSIREKLSIGKKYYIYTYFTINNDGNMDCNELDLGSGSGWLDWKGKIKAGLVGETGELYMGKVDFVATADDPQVITEPLPITPESISSGGSIQDAIKNVMNTLLDALKWALTLTAKAVNTVLQMGNNIDNEGVKDLWGASRNTVMSLILIALVLISFANVVQFNIEKYNISRMIPRLFISLVLVFVSYLYIQLLLAFAGAMQETLVGSFNFDSLASSITANSTFGLEDAANGIAQILLLIILIIFVFIVLAFLVIVLITRIVMIWFLTAIAPLAFGFRIMPFSEGLYTKWRDNLMKWIFMGPVAIYMLFFTSKIVDGFAQMTTGAGADADYSSIKSYVMLIMIAVGVFLSATVPITLGGSIMGKVAGKVKGAPKRLAKSPVGKKIGRATGIEGAMAKWNMRKNTLDKRYQQKYQKSFAEKGGEKGRIAGYMTGQGGLMRPSKRDETARLTAERAYKSALAEDIKGLSPEDLKADIAANGHTMDNMTFAVKVNEVMRQNSADGFDFLVKTGQFSRFDQMLTQGSGSFDAEAFDLAKSNVPKDVALALSEEGVMDSLQNNVKVSFDKTGARIETTQNIPNQGGAWKITEKVVAPKNVKEWDVGTFAYMARHHTDKVATMLRSKDGLMSMGDAKTEVQAMAGQFLTSHPRLTEGITGEDEIARQQGLIQLGRADERDGGRKKGAENFHKPEFTPSEDVYTSAPNQPQAPDETPEDRLGGM